MMLNTSLAAVVILTSSVISTVSATCYTSSAQWPLTPSVMKQLVDQECRRGAFTGTFRPGETKYKCINSVYGIKFEFWITNKNNQAFFNLNDEHCIGGLYNEIAGCSRGGEREISAWLYRSDPNSGSYGRCDILYVDPNDGLLEVFINCGTGNNLPTFTSIGKPDPRLKCQYENGLGIRDIAVQFADLTGNNRTDYLCMAPNGRTTGFIQGDNGGFTDVGQVKMSDNYDRANYNWADVNGDGKADLLWVEKFSGDAYVWYNTEQGVPGEFLGSAFSWRRQAPTGAFADAAYARLSAGTCEHFVDLDGSGRADLHFVLGTFNNQARTSFAPNCGAKDTIGDPEPYEELPKPPGPGPDVGGDENGNTCPGDPSWHTPYGRGTYFPSFLKGQASGYGPPARFDPDDETYLTLINGTPDDFRLDYNHSEQLYTEYTSVPAGEPREMWQSYRPRHTEEDSKAEAIYFIDGTRSTFQIWARTHFDGEPPDFLRQVYLFNGFSTDDQPMGEKQHEFGHRGGHRAFNFIITGSRKWKHYWTSLNPPTSWMNAILDIIGDRKLRHVNMIWSHDAGMSVLDGHTLGSSDSNTLTQYHDVYYQLLAGARYFDIRPVIGNGGEYLTGHYSYINFLKEHVGGNGESIQSIVGGITRFTKDNPELIILHLSHFFQTDDDYRDFDKSEYRKLFDILGGINHLRRNLKTNSITDMTMRELIGDDRACVIIITEMGEPMPHQGIYPAGEFDWEGEGFWSETDIVDTTADSQLEVLREKRNIAAGKDEFLVMQWILTLSKDDTLSTDDSAGISIRGFSTRAAYDALLWKAWDGFTPESYPNVVLLDTVGAARSFSQEVEPLNKELIAYSMAINLAIASKNCKVGGGTLY